MSFRKFVSPVVVTAFFAFAGAHASGADAQPADTLKDGRITAPEVRGFIVEESGATAKRGITPANAGINAGINYKKDGTSRPGQSRVGSASCKKGSDWKSYWTNTEFTRGTLCNGKVVLRKNPDRGRSYFQRKMEKILDRILLEGDLTFSGPGLVNAIVANDKKASVYFQKYNDAGKMTDTYLAISIEGSEVTVASIK